MALLLLMDGNRLVMRGDLEGSLVARLSLGDCLRVRQGVDHSWQATLGDLAAAEEHACRVVDCREAYSAVDEVLQAVWKDRYVERHLVESGPDECIKPVKQLVSEEHVIRGQLTHPSSYS
jgi:hypothetical protein